MDEFLKGKTKIKNSLIVFSALGIIIITLFVIYLYFSNEKLLAIISGLLTGFIVALFQTLLSLKALQKLDKYDNYNIIEILPRRNNRSYYKSLLSNARKKICVLGVTAQRFLHHFANEEDSEEGANLLLIALCKGVEVKILITDPKRLTGNDKRKAEIAESRLKELSEKFKDRFMYAYYDHEPMHSKLFTPSPPDKRPPPTNAKNIASICADA